MRLPSLRSMARRARRDVRAALRHRRGRLPDLPTTRRALSVDPVPTTDRSALTWWRRETANRGASPRPVAMAEPGDDGESVTVVCATNRPGNVEDMIANIARQSIVDRVHAVIVLNATGFDESAIDAQLTAAGCAAVSVLQLPAHESLGMCLRAGVAATEARYVAKFDDDDTYGPHHLERSIEVLQWSGAAVTGKHTYLVYLADTDETALRFPGREWSVVGFVAGGTIVMDRSRTGGAEFGDSDVGEDSAFLAAVERAGGLIVANSALGFVQYRGSSNTWQASTAHLLAGSSSVGRGDLRPLVAAG